MAKTMQNKGSAKLGEITEQSTVLDELPRDYDERGQHDLGYDRGRSDSKRGAKPDPTMPGAERGTATCQKAVQRVQPSTRAASSSERGSCRK